MALPHEKAIARIATLATGDPVDPSWRVTLHFHPDRLVGGSPRFGSASLTDGGGIAGLSSTHAARKNSAAPSTMKVVVPWVNRSASPSQTMLSPLATWPTTPAMPVIRPK